MSAAPCFHQSFVVLDRENTSEIMTTVTVTVMECLFRQEQTDATATNQLSSTLAFPDRR
jgi:hypothetical protein